MIMAGRPERRSAQRRVRPLAAVALASAIVNMSPALAARAVINTGPPAGFDDLLRPHSIMVDIVYGGRRVGQAMATSRPGALTFDDPTAVARLLPDVINRPTVAAALSGPLDAHARLVCSTTADETCGQLSPQVAGIIYDESRFRAEVFVNSRFRAVAGTGARYLPAPEPGWSLVDSFGAALAGSFGDRPTWSVQNRAIIGDREGRLRSDFFYASDLGFRFDTLVGEIDRPGVRYSGGLFWAPGIDLTGQRKIFGAGVGTQFDTRLDRDEVLGSPLVLFLPQRARVDILRNGRLLASRSYDAGNQTLDTEALPDGSYEVVLRITEIGGAVREERRFFVKSQRVPPLGELEYFGYAGVLSDDSGIARPTGTPFYEAGLARRLDERIALDGTLLGTSSKVMGEIGGFYIGDRVRLRLAGLVSSKLDLGGLAQVASAEDSDIGFSLDARQMWSRDGGPLIPVNGEVGGQSFGSHSLTGAELASGTFTQVSGNVTWRIGAAQLGVVGSWRRDKGSFYSIGPTLYWPMWQGGDTQIVLQGDAAKSSSGTAARLGVRIQLFRPHYSLIAAGGAASEDGRVGPFGEVSGSWQEGDLAGGDLQVSGSLAHELDRSFGSVDAQARTAYGSLFADLVHGFGGENTSTQYSLNVLSGAIANEDTIALGGRDIGEAAITVRLEGSARGGDYDVLVDGSRRAQVRVGEVVPIFLTPYRSYEVALRPPRGEPVSLDNDTRTVSVYPGSVAVLVWRADPLVTVFGRLVRPGGRPVADADIEVGHAIAQSDGEGWFQVEVGGTHALAVTPPDGAPCRADLPAFAPHEGYAAVGTVECR
jgi:hypothetical protein